MPATIHSLVLIPGLLAIAIPGMTGGAALAQPPELFVEPSTLVARSHRQEALPPTSTAADVLQRWQLASSVLEVPTDYDLNRLAVRHGSRLNGHELALVGKFTGVVDAVRLAEEYVWSLLRREDGILALSATPRDAVEALFIRRFELEIDAATHLPTSILFERAGQNLATSPIELDPQLSIDVRTALATSVSKSVENVHLGEPTVAAPRPMIHTVSYQVSSAAAAPLPAPADPLHEILCRWQTASTSSDAVSSPWRVAGLDQLLHDCEITVIRQSDQRVELQLVRRRNDRTSGSTVISIVLDRHTWLPIDVRPVDAIDFAPPAGP